MYRLQIDLLDVETEHPGDSDEPALTGRILRKVVLWPTIPKIEECLHFGGNNYPVTYVEHNMELSPDTEGAIRIEAEWWSGDFQHLWEKDSSWVKISPDPE